MHGIPDVMIPGKTWSRYCCLRFSSDFFSLSHGISGVTRSHSARSWRQIPWVLWFLARTKPRQSEAEQNPAIWTRTILPGSHLKAYHLLIIELNPIVHRNLGRRHFVSVSWTNLIDLVLLHEHWLLENAQRSCKQSLFFVRIGRLFWARCSSTLSLLRKRTCWRSFFNADAIKTSSISYSEKSLRPVIDCDVIRSSIDFAMSTSLIQCIVMWGHADSARTSVFGFCFCFFQLTFQPWNSNESGNFPRCISESGNLVIHHTMGE